VVIACAVNTSNLNHTFTGLTENYDNAVETIRYLAGSISGVVGSTAYAATIASTGASLSQLAAVSFR
jgi:hypothetical protein